LAIRLFINRELRGRSPSLFNYSPSPLKERGIKGVRYIKILFFSTLTV